MAVSFRDHDKVTLLLALKVRYVHLQFTSCPYLTSFLMDLLVLVSPLPAVGRAWDGLTYGILS